MRCSRPSPTPSRGRRDRHHCRIRNLHDQAALRTTRTESPHRREHRHPRLERTRVQGREGTARRGQLTLGPKTGSSAGVLRPSAGCPWPVPPRPCPGTPPAHDTICASAHRRCNPSAACPLAPCARGNTVQPPKVSAKPGTRQRFGERRSRKRDIIMTCVAGTCGRECADLTHVRTPAHASGGHRRSRARVP